MSEILLTTSPPVAARAHRAVCGAASCRSAAIYTPVLCVALSGRERLSRITLPTQVCSGHRESFEERFLTPARREQIERSLQSRGRDSPDWSRTHLEFLED